MSVAKVIEVIAESDESWEEAARKAVGEASETVRNIKHLWVEGMQASVEGNEITSFRMNAKITFVVGSD